jgi:hypothetical protein
MSTTIIRAPRRHRFVIIDQRAIEDTSLSWAARGLLGYLLSRPDDWKVLVNDLRKRGDLGRDGIYRLLRELRSAAAGKSRSRKDFRPIFSVTDGLSVLDCARVDGECIVITC